MIDLVALARGCAVSAHAGQFRKGDPPRPYIVHPLDVHARLVRHGVTDEVTLAAALLHDVVEDCGFARKDIYLVFGAEVADVVMELTDAPGATKKEARAEQVRRAPTMSPAAKLVKLADKTSNLVDVVEHPPGWSPAVARAYCASARRVVEALGVEHAGLLADFEAACRAIEGT